MKSLPIDTRELTFLFAKVEPKVNFDTKLQDTERDTGALAWLVHAFAVDEVENAVLKVRVFGREEPLAGTRIGTVIEFGNLRSRMWQQGERADNSFSAQNVRVQPVVPDLPATNGKAKTEAPASA